MSLEQAIKELTEAVIANTKAHAQLGEIAKATVGAKQPAKVPAKSEEPDEQPEEEAEKPKKAPAKKEPAKEPAKKPVAKKTELREMATEVDSADLRGLARTFMSKDHDNRDQNKDNFAAALAHLGAARLTEVTAEDEARLFAYITYWNEGLEVDFEEVDERLVELAGDDADEGDEDGDDMLG